MTRIGPHRLLCGDVTAGAVKRLMGRERADVVYSDPPWGPGNLQYWATMHDRGSMPAHAWPVFLSALCCAIAAHRKPDAPVFVEMGLRWVEALDAAMARRGLARCQRWTITYGPRGKPLPQALSLYGRNVTVDLPSPPHGEAVTRAALRAAVLPGSVVLDPCTGLGMTARGTALLGGHFRGAELNPARLARTAAWLTRHTP